MLSLKFRSELLQIYFYTGSFHPLHCYKENLSSSVTSASTNNVCGVLPPQLQVLVNITGLETSQGEMID